MRKIVVEIYAHKNASQFGRAVIIDKDYEPLPKSAGLSVHMLLILSSVLIPPLLLLNIPILLLRSYLTQNRKSRHTEIQIEASQCPQCQKALAFRHDGDFPFGRKCSHCQTSLTFSPIWSTEVGSDKESGWDGEPPLKTSA